MKKLLSIYIAINQIEKNKFNDLLKQRLFKRKFYLTEKRNFEKRK